MLDDIVELVLDVLGEVLEAAVSLRRKKDKRPKKQTPAKDVDPWEHRDQAAPWEK